MNMDKASMLDAALDKILGELDDVEGKGAMSHSMDECPDPFNCKEHESDSGSTMTPDGGEPSIKIEISKMRLPSMEGKEGPAEDGLSSDEQEELKKLLK